MKQETPQRTATPTAKSECRTVLTRFRASPRAKEADNALDRAKSVPPDMKNGSSRAQKSPLLKTPKSGDNAVGSQKFREVDEAKMAGRVARTRLFAEQLMRSRRLRPAANAGDGGSRKSEEGMMHEKEKKKNKCEELQEKVVLSEDLVKSLQREVLTLKAELENVQSLNVELESKNRKLTEDLATAETKIAALSSSGQMELMKQYPTPKFKDIQKLIANKLENPRAKREVHSEAIFKPVQPVVQSSSPKVIHNQVKPPTSLSLSPPPPPIPSLPPPPPPPLPPSRPRARGSAAPKTPPVVEFYRFLTKQEGKREQQRSEDSDRLPVTSAHSSIVGEIQNRSAHLLAIKADIDTKGDFINDLIQKIQSAAFSDIEEVLKFVDWLDNELSSLADERAVLKHFKWPEKKADAMREAAVEYRKLKMLQSEISLYKDSLEVPCGVALKKMAGLLDKSERGIQRLVKLRSSAIRSYQDCKIPVDWMLDSGMVYKIKQASMRLANMYMKRVTMEFESMRNSDRESTQEALLLQGVHFAYRAHQFAGGLDSETLCAFEEIRRHVPGHLRGSPQLLAGITSS